MLWSVQPLVRRDPRCWLRADVAQALDRTAEASALSDDVARHSDLVRGPREVWTEPGCEWRFWGADRGALSVDRVVMIEAASRDVLDLSRSILAELDVDVVLERVLQAARELTGARYAALGVLDASAIELERFITVG